MAKKIYGTINDFGHFVKIPKKVKANGRIYHNPKGEICKKLGYYELITSECPNDDKEYIDTYELQGEYIYQRWVEAIMEETPEIEIPEDNIESDITEPTIPTLEERVALLEREMDFIMEFGKFKNHWLDEENKHHNYKH